MIERLLELMRMKSLTSSQLADAIGVQRSGISHFVSGRNKPSLEFILKILRHFPDINPDWLLFGTEDVFRNGSPVLAFGKNPEMQSGNTGISLNEDLPVSQPSLMNELFSESGKSWDSNEKEAEQTAKSQAARQRQSPGKETKTVKKETSGDEYAASDPGHKESPERIVIFYKNRLFREYFPE